MNINSGQDIKISGSQVAGDKVTADISGNLNIESLQDTNIYKSDSKYAGGSITIGSGGGIQASAGMSKMDSDYASVTNQAGIYAGKEGFDITVGKNTDLKGAVIDSNATPDKNKLDTGTISFSDIENRAEYSASNIGVGIDTRPVKDPQNHNSGGVDKKDAGITPSIGGTDGKDSSTTKSAVAEGEITIRDEENQKQDVKKLSRDPKNAHKKLDKIFDKDKILTQQELVKVFGEVGFKAVGDILTHYKIPEGSAQAIALHSVVGGIMAQLNGGGFAEGMSVAAINNLIISQLGNMKDEKGKPLFTAAELRWISATVGATVSKAVGGNTGQGAGIADSATRNNWLTHKEQLEMNERLANAKTPEERIAILKKYYELSEKNILSNPTNPESMDSQTIESLQALKKLGEAGIYFVVDDNQGMHNNLKAAIDFYNIYNVVKHGPDLFTNVVIGTAAVVSSPIAVVSGVITYGSATYTLYKDYQNADGLNSDFMSNVTVEGAKTFVMWGIDKVSGKPASFLIILGKAGVSVFMDINLKK